MVITPMIAATRKHHNHCRHQRYQRHFWLKPADAPSLFRFFMSMPSSSASSSDASSESSETGKSSGDPLVRRLCCHWLPRSYLLVLVINATATGLLWPADDQDADHDAHSCPLLKMRLFFSGLMLSSLGAGFVAAFLVRRAEASPHTRWACGVNWIQATPSSTSPPAPSRGASRSGTGPRSNTGVSGSRAKRPRSRTGGSGRARSPAATSTPRTWSRSGGSS